MPIATKKAERHTVERCGTEDARIIMFEGNVVGFAEKLTTNRWGAYNTEDMRLTCWTFSSPAQVASWFDTQRWFLAKAES